MLYRVRASIKYVTQCRVKDTVQMVEKNHERLYRDEVSLNMYVQVYEKNPRLHKGCLWFKEVFLAVDTLGFYQVPQGQEILKTFSKLKKTTPKSKSRIELNTFWENILRFCFKALTKM